MKKILILGKSGMLGKEIYKRFLQKENLEVFATDSKELNICDKNNLFKKILDIRPNIIINCVAYTNVEGCEKNFNLAKYVNSDAVLYLSEISNEISSTLIHFSTDYVFDGKLDINKEYTENMEPNPINLYGKTKLLGEINALKSEKCYIFRTSWLYGDGKNFVRKILYLSKTKDILDIVSDQIGSPTSTIELTNIVEKIIEINPDYGIYHATNDGFVSWADFANDIFKILGLEKKINYINSIKFKSNVKRPKNSKLLKNKLKKIGISPEFYLESLKKYLLKENYL